MGEHGQSQVHWEDGEELVERFMWGSAEGSCYDSDCLVLDCLELFDQSPLFACVPELATIGQHQETNGIIGKMPSCMVQAMN